MKHKILFVDDEKNILSSLNRQLRNENYELFFATSPKEGLELLSEHTMSVIVSDMRMPEMNGVEFLAKSREISDDSVRIILSAFSEIDNIMSAVNTGHVWHYITKPWNAHELSLTLSNAVSMYEQIAERKRLLEELARKNRQLEELNTSLERKVRARTWMLQERTEILNMLIEDTGIAHIAKRICEDISKVVQGKPTYLISPFLDTPSKTKDGKIPERITKLGEKTLEKKENGFEGETSALCLHKGADVLGAILIDELKEDAVKTVTENIGSYVSLIILALNQQKMQKDTPTLLKRVDRLIEAVGE